MTDKIDIYRLFRGIDAIRKGFYWQSVDSVDKRKQAEYLRRHLNLLKRVDSLSSSSLSLIIFSTSVFVALLQLLQSIEKTLDVRYTIPLIAVYVLSLLAILVSSFIKKRMYMQEMDDIEDKISSILDDEMQQIKEAELMDSTQMHLTELSLLDEIGEEAINEFHENRKSQKDLENLLDSISSKTDGIKRRIDQKRRALDKLRHPTDCDNKGG